MGNSFASLHESNSIAEGHSLVHIADDIKKTMSPRMTAMPEVQRGRAVAIEVDDPIKAVAQICPLNGFKYTKGDANGVRVDEEHHLICLHGRIEQTKTMEGFFNGEMARINMKQAFPKRYLYLIFKNENTIG